MEIKLNLSMDAIEHMVDYLDFNSDESCSDGPLPPSALWLEFREELALAYESIEDDEDRC